jgi:hypothetical protein
MEYAVLDRLKAFPGLEQSINHCGFIRRIALVCLWLFLSPVVAWGAENGLIWSVTPYIWASDTKYDLKLGDTPIGGQVKFDDLLDTTDSSFQFVSELGQEDGNWSAFLDLTYLKTSDDYKGPILFVDSRSEVWYLDAAVAWWPRGEQGGLSLYGGVRYTDLDDKLAFFLSEDRQLLRALRNDRDFLDGLLGVRQFFTLAERWTLLAQADYSTGESDGIYQLQALVRYGMGKQKQYGLMLGYRYKEAEFEHDDIEEKFEYKGPLIGFNFRF